MSRMYINKYTYENPIKTQYKTNNIKNKIQEKKNEKNSTIGFLK